MKRKIRITKLPKAQSGGSYRDYDCPPGSDCAKVSGPLNIHLPNFFAGDGSGRDARREAASDKKFNADPNLWLGTRAQFYQNNTDYGKYPVINWDPQPQKDGVIDYGPNNFPVTGDNRLLPSPNLFARFGGNTGDQKGYALYVNNNVPAEPEQNEKLRDFIPVSPRDESNIEAENGETLLADMDGDGELEHMKIGGKRHSEGGTPLNVPSGSFIFSDTPKMKIGGEILQHFGKPKDTKKQYTPAKLAKQYDLNFYKDKLAEDNTDKFSKNTAKLMLDNNQKKLALLAATQEYMKGNPIPGVSDTLMETAPQMRFGGIPSFQSGGGFKPWPGDKYENKNNGSKYTASQIAAKARALGYTGPEDNLSLQKWIQEQQGLSNQRVDELHAAHLPIPHGGKLDGKWGYRWDTALDGLGLAQASPINSSLPALNTTSSIRVPKLPTEYNPNQIASTPATNLDRIPTGDANFTTGKQTDVTPNAWDVMGVLNAATRPIDHIRPQLFRTDAEVTPPSLYDNTAEIQQLQSIAKTNNDTINSTADGQVSRANISSNIGRLFDPINSSNMRTEQANVGTMNQFNQYRDQVVNNKNQMNLGLLDKFINEDNMYKANLSKEKQMKKTDTILQGQNLTNNMITLGSILERTPNYSVKGPFWNPSVFVPGSGNLLKGNNQDSGDSLSGYEAQIKALTEKGYTADQAINILKLALGRTSTTESDNDNNGYPNSRRVTTSRRV